MDFLTIAADYLERPSAAGLHRLRIAVQSAEGYSPSSGSLAEAARRIDLGLTAEALGLLQEDRAANFLSPRGHALFSRALRASGQGDLADFEQRLGEAALDTLLTSGDGSRERPYIVLRVSDEYDVLTALGFVHTRQGVVMIDRMPLDVFEATDGAEVWFELFRGGGAA